jgi:peptidoglycan lytic transglycosylase
VSRSRAERARAAGLVAVVIVVAGAVLLGCAADAEARRPARASKDVQEGHASYYGDGFDGRRTASGERYDPRKLTAAHKSLPLGTRVRVTRTSGGVDGPSVEVRVNDRCGCTHGRVIDLSLAAARRLHMLGAGVVPVRIEVLGPR